MSSSVAPVKKFKVKETHRMAIEHYEKWLKNHPEATHGERYRKFDESIDLAARIRERQ